MNNPIESGMGSHKQPARRAPGWTILFFFIALVSIVYVPISRYAIAHAPHSDAPVDEAYPFTSYNSDARAYVWLADALIENGSLAMKDATGYVLETNRTPVYPLFLAGIKLLTGGYLYAIYFQMIIVALTAFIIARIGAKVFSKSIGIAAGIFYILDPNTITHTLSIMTDILFVLMFVVFIDMLCQATNKKNYGALFFAGVVAGIAALTRPIGLYLPLIAGFGYAILQLPKKKLTIIIAEVMLLLIGSGISIVPWMARNHRITGMWSLSSVGTTIFFHYYVPQYLSFRDHQDINVLRARMEAEAPALHEADFWKMENIGTLKKIDAKYLHNDFLGYGAFHIIKSLSLFVSSGSDLLLGQIIFPDSPAFKVSTQNNISSSIMRGDVTMVMKELAAQPITSLEYLFWICVVALAFCSLWSPGARQWSLAFWILILYFPLLSGPLAYARFRLPASPLMFLLAFEGIRILKNRIKKTDTEGGPKTHPSETSI